MGGGISSNLHAVFFEIDDVITPASDGKNNLEVNLGNLSGKDSAKVGGCLVTEGKFSGGDSHIRLPGFKIDSKCCLLYTSPSPRDGLLSRMPSSA